MVVIDTDALIEFSKGNAKIAEKIKQLQAVEQLATTVFNAEEFFYGLLKKGREEEIAQGYSMLQKIKNYGYTQKETEAVIKIKLELEKEGKSIGPYDECIAGICITKNEALYTLNRKHFERVKQLKLI